MNSYQILKESFFFLNIIVISSNSSRIEVQTYDRMPLAVWHNKLYKVIAKWFLLKCSWKWRPMGNWNCREHEIWTPLSLIISLCPLAVAPFWSHWAMMNKMIKKGLKKLYSDSVFPFTSLEDIGNLLITNVYHWNWP